MKKKIKDLTFTELKQICKKHIIYNRMLCEPQCQENCPLLMKKKMMVVDNTLNHNGLHCYNYTKESCCFNFAKNQFDVETFSNKKVKVEEQK